MAARVPNTAGNFSTALNILSNSGVAGRVSYNAEAMRYEAIPPQGGPSFAILDIATRQLIPISSAGGTTVMQSAPSTSTRIGATGFEGGESSAAPSPSIPRVFPGANFVSTSRAELEANPSRVFAATGDPPRVEITAADITPFAAKASRDITARETLQNLELLARLPPDGRSFGPGIGEADRIALVSGGQVSRSDPSPPLSIQPTSARLAIPGEVPVETGGSSRLSGGEAEVAASIAGTEASRQNNALMIALIVGAVILLSRG